MLFFTHTRAHHLPQSCSHQSIMGFNSDMIRDIMRLVVAVLYAGNMTFTETNRGETCILDEDEASLAVASLLGVSYEKLAASLTCRVLFLREGNITKELNSRQAYKASEALIKSIYGANCGIDGRRHDDRTIQRRDGRRKFLFPGDARPRH